MWRWIGAGIAIALGILIALRSSRVVKSNVTRHEAEAFGHAASSENVEPMANRANDTSLERGHGGVATTAWPLDPKRREELRRQLLIALARGAAEPAGGGTSPSTATTSSAAPPNQPMDVEELSRAINDTIRSQFAPMAEGCYKDLLARKPDAKGSVVMRFEILAEPSLGGVVNDADFADDTTLREPSFDTCLRESFLSMSFDSMRTTGRATVKFPFDFADGKIDASYPLHLKDRR